MKSRLFAKVCYNSLWLRWRGVWWALLLHSRARGASASGVKSVYPDPKARMSPRRKSLRGAFARLSFRKHRKRQVSENSAHSQLDQSAASARLFAMWTTICSELNKELDWFIGICALLFKFSFKFDQSTACASLLGHKPKTIINWT